jgi:hypothetical protein
MVLILPAVFGLLVVEDLVEMLVEEVPERRPQAAMVQQ